MLHISIKPEVIFEIFGLSITNSLITNIIVLILFTIIALLFKAQSKDGNSTFVFFIRFMMKKLHGMFEPILGGLTNEVFPIIASFFVFIIMANWIGLLPGVGSIVIEHQEEGIMQDESVNNHKNVNKTEHDNANESSGHTVKRTPILRGGTADLNTTIALALISFTLIQYFGFSKLGFSYIKKFINIADPMSFFTGILEIVSEISKIISFAFRLFGNIFAGEVLMAVIAFLVPILASFPFLMLEIFVGFIQALVFAMLTSVFIRVATISHSEH